VTEFIRQYFPAILVVVILLPFFALILSSLLALDTEPQE